MERPDLSTLGSSTKIMPSEKILKTVAIKSFLDEKAVVDFAKLYSHDMECQVIVNRGDGRPIQKEYKGMTYSCYVGDHGEEWKALRIPYKSGTKPEYTDSPMTYDLEKHVLGIGMTGWNWKERKSVFVAFDFDSIVNHSGGLNEGDLQEIKRKAFEIPWVNVYTSTSGTGYHLYVYLDVPEVNNHHEHAALARAVLCNMSALAGFDFKSKIDICGGNMWCWHRKMYDGDQIVGFRKVKEGVPLTQIPPNWRAHVKVVKERAKTVDLYTRGDQNPDIDKVLNERMAIPLDDKHIEVIKTLEGKGSWWDGDHHLLVTHTTHLKETHTALNLAGIFETIAKGSGGEQDRNCFAIPRPNGAWIIRRYGEVGEAPSWFTDAWGYTCCYFNRNADLHTMAISRGAVETEKRGFLFNRAEEAAKLIEAMGCSVELPVTDRETTIKDLGGGRVLLKINKYEGDSTELFKGFEANKDKTWSKIIRYNSPQTRDIAVSQFDGLCRHLISGNNSEAGWVINTDAGFIEEPSNNVKLAIKAKGFSAKDTESILGGAILCPWRIVCRPFEPEYPGNRCWNKNAPQLLFQVLSDTEELKYPTWLRILDHLGQNLDEAVRHDKWCQQYNINTGSSYLKLWCACLFQFPTQPLPYLFFVGKQNSGKTILHEALSMLFYPGYMKGDLALTNPSAFNGELQNVILAYVEEVDLSQNGQAYNRIKDWVTSIALSVHAKHQTPIMIPNTTHWIQCANDPSYCPIFPGDTRIVMVDVNPLPEDQIIPKSRLLEMLREEASAFLTELLYLDIPKSPDRLRIPPVTTEIKRATALANRNDVEVFISNKVFEHNGEYVRLDELYDAFLTSVSPQVGAKWGKMKFNKEVQSLGKFIKGRHPSGFHIWGNMSYNQCFVQKEVKFVRNLEANNEQLILEKIYDC